MPVLWAEEEDARETVSGASVGASSSAAPACIEQ
jgi:hypothetical protein